MYADKLLNTYKSAKNYVQDKQIAHDLAIQPNKISKIRSGERQLTENEAIFIAREINLDLETVLIYLAADRSKNHQVKEMWENLAKKLNSQGLQRLSMACGGLAMFIGTPKEAMAQCALYILC
ncbi:DUF3693 domain-containing protein [Aliivibrio wodanis]|uniref:DUF3693 domain-containing protein n=1 Tax=Aliivibrio wodanis TaxID=80852 RepID=UPI00406D1854